MSWAEMKKAVNDTVGTQNFKPLDKIVSDASYDAVYELASLTSVSGVAIHPKRSRVNDGEYEGEDIQKIFLPRTIETIGENSFKNTRLTDLVLPSSVKEIKSGAFSVMSALEVVTFKGKPTTISNTTFITTPALEDIYVPWSEGEVQGAPWGAAFATIHYNWR